MIATTDSEQANEVIAMPRNTIISASITVELYDWLVRRCQALRMTKSGFVTQLIADARAREQEAKPC